MWSVTEISGDYRGVSVFCRRMRSADSLGIMVLLWCFALDVRFPPWKRREPSADEPLVAWGFKLWLVWKEQELENKSPKDKLWFPVEFPAPLCCWGHGAQRSCAVLSKNHRQGLICSKGEKTRSLSKKCKINGGEVGWSLRIYLDQCTMILSFDEIN